MRLWLLEGSDAREFFAFKKLQGRSAARRDVRHLLRHASLLNRGRGVAAANDGCCSRSRASARLPAIFSVRTVFLFTSHSPL